MIFLCIPLVILFYMLGGQIHKTFRPVGVTLSIIGVYLLWHNHPWWCVLPTLCYAGMLNMGYGVDSKLMKWLQSEQKVRIVLGIIIGVPVLATVALTHNWFALVGFPLIVGCSCIRLGSWGKIGKYDILPVDIFRGLAVGLAMSLALI
jgi:hypothetical protein